MTLPNEPTTPSDAPVEGNEPAADGFSEDFAGWDESFGDFLDKQLAADTEAAPADTTIQAEGQELSDQTEERQEPVTPAPVAAPAPTAPAPAAVQPVQPAPAAAPVAPAPAAPTSDSSALAATKFHEIIDSRRPEFVSHLAQTAFRLSPDEAAMFEDERVPQFVAERDAKLYLHIMGAVSKILDSAIPQVIRNVVTNDTVAERHESEFYTQFPGLNNPQYTAGLTQLALTIRKAQPNLTRNELMATLGRTASALYNVVPSSTPAAPAVRTKQTPFVPGARAGGGTQTKPQGATVVAQDPLAAMSAALRADLD